MTSIQPSSSSGPLETLEHAVQSVDGTAELAYSARAAFRLLEPWCLATASSSIPLINVIIAGVKDNAVLYFDAIDLSIKTSLFGSSFVDDALSLCEFLQDGQSVDDIVSFIDSMQATAQKTRRGAEDTLAKFREVRQGLLQIIHNINQASAQVSHDHRTRNSQHHSAAPRRASARGSNFLGSAAAILIPTLLPPVAFVAQKIEERYAYKAGVRTTQELSFTDAARQLDAIRHDMEELVEHVTGFSRWWAGMDSALDSLRSSISRLSPSPLQLQRVPIIQQRWAYVRDRYQGYYFEINKLQDFYPILYLRSKPDFEFGRFVNFERTMSIVSRHTDQCQIALRTLHTIATTGDRQMTGTHRDNFSNMLVHLKSEWELLLHHLDLVLSFSHGVADGFNVGRMDDAEIMRWSVAIDGLAKSSKQVVDLHACVLKTFQPTRDAISRHMTRRMRAEAQPVFDSSIVDSPDDEANGRTTTTRRRRDTARDPDGVSALRTFEATLGELDTHFQDISSFWRARLAGFPPSNIHSPTTGRPLGSRDFWQIDGETTYHYRECISASLDGLTLVVPQVTKGKRRRIREWLRLERS